VIGDCPHAVGVTNRRPAELEYNNGSGRWHAQSLRVPGAPAGAGSVTVRGVNRPMSNRQRAEVASERRRRTRSESERRQRRRQVVAIIVVAGLVLSSGGAIIASIILSATGRDTTTPTTVADATDPPPAVLDLPAPGAVATTTSCPPEVDAPERTTSFPGAPPVCIATTADGGIDTSVDYVAVVSTSVGDLTYLLSTAVAPDAVNSFVFLARYGYFNGSPFDTVLEQSWAQAGSVFAGEVPGGNGAPPGWTVPSETPEGGMVATPGMLGMAAGPGGQVDPGRLVVALGPGAGSLPEATPFFGVLLDGSDALAALFGAGTPSGRPRAAVDINAITVTEAPQS